uniref:Uncharacterized protein n=2 Tax=Nostocales TaxID=1161 RepID=A0A0C1NB89_9CYAN
MEILHLRVKMLKMAAMYVWMGILTRRFGGKSTLPPTRRPDNHEGVDGEAALQAVRPVPTEGNPP